LTYEVENWKGKDTTGQEKVEKVLVITSAVAKRKAKKKPKQGEDNNVYKAIALPTAYEYEPWTLDLLKYMQRNKNRLCFDLTTQRINQLIKEYLHDLDPEITSKSMRHYRITHLRKYQFSPYDTILYTGWTFRTGFGMIGMPTGNLDTYLHSAWTEYFPKLMQPLRELYGYS
jgi:hypothetical protein